MTDLPIVEGTPGQAGVLPGFDPTHALDCYARWAQAEFAGGQLFYKGRRIIKHPVDVWCYIEAIQYTKPDLIIECGTYEGGSALLFADLIGEDGVVVTIDVEDRALDFHSEPPGGMGGPGRIHRIIDSSTDPIAVGEVSERAAWASRVMVVLDSDHSTHHVLAELEAYAPLVTPGCYLVVEDTNYGGNPVPMMVDGTDGPMGALRKWVPDHPEFGCDVSKHRWGQTFNPYGWLIRLDTADPSRNGGPTDG